jgi:hypothetical protein
MIRWIAIAAFGAGLFFAAGTGAADNKAEAKKHFKSGIALFKAEKFAGAAVEFDESSRLYKTKGALFNLANCYKALSRYAEALATLKLLEGEFKGTLSEEMLSGVKQLRDEINSVTGELGVKVNRNGAEIYVDDELVGRSPLSRPLLLGPGYHVLRVQMKGMETYSRKVKLVSGANLKLEVNFKSGKTTPRGVLLRESVTQPEPEPVEPMEEKEGEEEEEEKGGKKLGPAPLIIAGALTVGFGVTSLVLNKKIGDKSDEAKSTGDTDMMKEAESLQTAGKVMVGLTVASLATAVVLLFFTDFKGDEEEPVSETAWRVDGVSPILTGDGGGLALCGRF